MNNIVEEQVFLDMGKIRVTSARFVADDRTFAMASISSVRPIHVEAKRSPIGLLIVIAGIAACIVPASRFWGILAVVAGVVHVLIQRSKRDQWFVGITTAGGEVCAYEAPEDFVRKVVSSVADAIVHRG